MQKAKVMKLEVQTIELSEYQINSKEEIITSQGIKMLAQEVITMPKDKTMNYMETVIEFMESKIQLEEIEMYYKVRAI